MKAIDDLEQYGRREMLETAGIPTYCDQDCEEIAINLASKLCVTITSNDIAVAQRNSMREEATLLVKYNSSKICQKLLSKDAKREAKKSESLTLVTKCPIAVVMQATQA
eukprot:gene5830-6527_t